MCQIYHLLGWFVVVKRYVVTVSTFEQCSNTVDTLIPHTCRETAKSMGFHRLWLVGISAHPLAPLGTHSASTSWTIGWVKYVLWLTDMNILPVTSHVYRTDIVLGICSLEWRLSAPRDLCTSP